MAAKPPLVSVQGVTKYFIRKRSFLTKTLTRQRDIVVKAVDGVDLEIWEGETIGLVGESGCGKSTLGRTIIRLHEPSSGHIFFEDQDISMYKSGELMKFRQEAQIIFQNPYSSLNPRKTVREILSVPLAKRGVHNLRDREEEIKFLLHRVGLAERHIDRYPHQFSGGQRQRIGIARALAMKPRFVVADEPVSALDVSVQAQIINLLAELQQEYQLTYLFVAHDLSVVFHVSDRVAVMYLGKIVEVAETAKLFERPLHPYTQALLSAIPVVERGSRKERIILSGTVPSPIDPPKGCRFHTRCFMKKGQVCETQEPSLADAGSSHRVACHLYM
ncbi:peptide ABC transporter ATPase [Clostridiales bacterium PH28_bin88]|nr:peptide ABC transporter ATPase [Clostridiales bacterium PH28_bin88]